MAKLTTSDLSNLQNETTAVTTINNNFTAVETALENTLSRDGTTPNTMSASLDMNGNAVLNLPAPGSATSPVRVQDLEDYIDQINGTGGAVLNSPGAGEVNKLAKVASAGVIGYTNIEADGSYNIHPTTTDVGALGTSSKMWADLFLASGGVINFNASNYTITHSAGNLAFSGTTTLTGVVTATAGVRPLANDGAALGSTSLSWADLFLASGAVLNFDNGNYTLTHSSGLLTASGNLTVTGNSTHTGTSTHTGVSSFGTTTDAAAYVKLGAGTSSIAPLKFTSGTNLTSATAGAVEYDGNVFYSTPVSSARGLSPSTQFSGVSTAVALSNSSTSAQNLLPAASDTITLASSTTYLVEGVFFITNGTTTHTTSWGAGGTATFSGYMLNVGIYSGAAAAQTSVSNWTTFVNNTAAVLNSTSAAAGKTIMVRGVLRVNVGGTWIPQITFSAGPTGTCQVEPGSFITLTPIGTNTVTAIGNWS